MATITEIAGSQTEQAPDLFVSPERQIENVRLWSRLRGWGFTEANFEQAKAQLASITRPARYLNALVLVPHLDTMQRTFEELWGVAAFQQTNHWRFNKLKSDAERLRLRSGITHRPGLRWEVIKLGANPGKAPADIPTVMVAHADVLAAAAHFPNWIQAMDGDNVPYVWMAGYQCSDPVRKPWRSVPYLLWTDPPYGVMLATGADDDQADGCWATPVRWEC